MPVYPGALRVHLRPSVAKKFLFPQTCFAPEQIDPIQHIGRQPDHFWPWAREAFSRPLASGKAWEIDDKAKVV